MRKSRGTRAPLVASLRRTRAAVCCSARTPQRSPLPRGAAPPASTYVSIIASPVPSPANRDGHAAASPIRPTSPADQRGIRIWLTRSKYKSRRSRPFGSSNLGPSRSPCDRSASCSVAFCRSRGGSTPIFSARHTSITSVSSSRSDTRAICCPGPGPRTRALRGEAVVRTKRRDVGAERSLGSVLRREHELSNARRAADRRRR